jgi:hypothetical protein
MPIQPTLFAMVGKRLASGADWLIVDGNGGAHPKDGCGGGGGRVLIAKWA